jgi:hypothetical protein
MNHPNNNTEIGYKPFDVEPLSPMPQGIGMAHRRKAALEGAHPEFGKTTTEKGEHIGKLASEAFRRDRETEIAESVETQEGEK